MMPRLVLVIDSSHDDYLCSPNSDVNDSAADGAIARSCLFV
jgi:hypothetical protein